MSDIEQQLLDAMRRSGLSMKALTERSGLRYQSVHGFMRTGRGLTLASAAKLCTLLGLELRPLRSKKGRVAHG